MPRRAFSILPGAEAESFHTAFLRFLEMRGPALAIRDEYCAIQSMVGDGGETKLVTLWDEAAVAEFVLFWRQYRAEYVVGRQGLFTERSRH